MANNNNHPNNNHPNNPIVYQPLDQPISSNSCGSGYQSFGPPLSSSATMRFPNSPPPESGPSAADRQLPDVAEVVEDKPTGAEGTEVKDFAIKEETEKEAEAEATATTPTKATMPPPRSARSPPLSLAAPTATARLELPESESTGSLDKLTLNSFPLPSRNASPIPPSLPQSPRSPMSPMSPTPPGDTKPQEAGLAVLNKTKDILAAAALSKATTPVETKSSTPEPTEATEADSSSPVTIKASPVVEKAAVVRQQQTSSENEDTPPDTPTKEDTAFESTPVHEKVASRVNTPVVVEQEISRPQTPDSWKPDVVNVHDSREVFQEDVQEEDEGTENNEDDIVETEIERSSFDSEPPLSPISLPSGDAEPSLTANWPLPAVFILPPPTTQEKAPEQAPEQIVEKVIEVPAAITAASTTPATPMTPATPVTPTTPNPTINLDNDDEDDERGEADEDELFPSLKASPTKSKSAFTASVYARDIGLGPYAFDGADINGSNVENLTTEALDLKAPTGAPWALPARLDSLEKAPQQKLVPKTEPEVVVAPAPAPAPAVVAPSPSPEPPAVPPKDADPQVEEAVEAAETEAEALPTPQVIGAFPETPDAVEADKDEKKDALATQAASPESEYSWGGGDAGRGLVDDDSDVDSDGHHHLDEEDTSFGPLSPDSIGLARGPSIIESEADRDADRDELLESPSKGGKKRWAMASHLAGGVDGDVVLHERIIGVGGGVGNGGSAIKGDGPPKLAVGQLNFDRHSPTGMVDSFGTTFI